MPAWAIECRNGPAGPPVVRAAEVAWRSYSSYPRADNFMKIALFTAPRTLEIAEAPQPTLHRDDDVLVRIDRVGVCGSDVHYYTHGRIGQQVLSYPATLGHECAGTVLEVGHRVTDLQPGDQVAVEPAFACGKCDQCLAGRQNTCRKLVFMGCPNEAPGAVAEFHVLPRENCIAVPKTMSLDDAALVEPLSIGLHAVRLGAPAAGAKLAIFGAGPIGLSVLLCAKALAPCRAYVTDLIDCRLEAATACGADATANVGAGGADVVAWLGQREPLGVDVVFECSGDPACIDQAMQALVPGGTVVLVGIPERERIEFDVHLMRRKEITFRNVRRQNQCVGPVIELMAAGRIDARPMLTHHFPLGQITEAFETVAGYRDGVIKAMLTL